MSRSLISLTVLGLSLFSCQFESSTPIDNQDQTDTNLNSQTQTSTESDTTTEPEISTGTETNTSNHTEIEPTQCNTFNPEYIFITDIFTVHISSEILDACNNSFSWTLDMGDGTILTNQSYAISHTYADYGQYTVTLIDEDNNYTNNYSTIINIEQPNTQTQTSCAALDSVDIKNLNVTDLLTININADNTYYGCDEHPAQVSIESTEIVAFTKWNEQYTLDNGNNSIELPFMGEFKISTDIQTFYVTLTENEYQISDSNQQIISEGVQQVYPNCYWTLTHLDQHIYNLNVNDNDQCEQLAQSTKPTINWGDGSALEQIELGYNTHKFNTKLSNFFAADYIVEISSNNSYISDIKHIIENKHGASIGVSCGISGSTSLFAYGENFYAYPQQISPNPVAFTLPSSTGGGCAANIQGTPSQSIESVDFGDNSELTSLPTNNSSIWHIYPLAGQYNLPLVSPHSVSQIDVTDEINTNAPFLNCEDTSALITLTDSRNELSNDNLLRDFNTTALMSSNDGCTYWNNNQFNWDFGDGAKYTNVNSVISHEFLKEGIYPVTVETSSELSTISRTKLYNANSQPSIEDSIACRIIAPQDNLNINITTNALAIEIDTTNLSFTQTNPCDLELTSQLNKWDFGDGSIIESNDTFISHTYEQVGEYEITLTLGFEEDFVTVTKKITVE